MKVLAIRNYGLSTPVTKNQRMSNLRETVPQTETLKGDTVSFRSKASAGAGLGALIGLGAMGLISALSGGVAAPIAYGVYAAVGGVAGGFTGNAFDKAEENKSKGA